MRRRLFSMAKQMIEKTLKKTSKKTREPRPVRLRNRKPSHWQLWLMTLPALIYMLLFVYKPMGGILIAFQDYSLKKGIWGSDWVWFDNFTRLFRSYWFPIILKKTRKP